MDVAAIREFVERAWRDRVLPALEAYVAIPNQSPAFDTDWRAHGHMDRAVALVAGWIRAQDVPGLTLEVVQHGERTPVVVVEIPGTGADGVLLYGHLDKQPPMDGWLPGLGPWTPVVRDGRLYGRGAADDGYAAFAAITALAALAAQGVPHARCVLLLEASEESGSTDLPYYVDALADRIGRPSLVVCLDSGCGTYDRLWMTTSLRGLVNATLGVSTLTEGVHSGTASGIVPSSFRVLRQLLDRLEDARTGRVLPGELHVAIPPARVAQAEATARTLGAGVWSDLPFQPAARPVSGDARELLLNRTWRPQLEITGAGGLPALERAGNVLRPATIVQLSLRLPPTADPAVAIGTLRRLLVEDPPYGAAVTFTAEQGARGWDAPPLAPWLERSARAASLAFFGREACSMGEGGTIPFMAMLGARFPQAQFLVTGVLGPHANAHGPNEFLDLATAQRLTACVAHVLADHHAGGR
ncbi:MAG: M20/M25/M40 family metallo-hydrolase [Candidatus Binatia bacterium]